MKYILSTLFSLMLAASVFAQIRFKIEVLPDAETYLVSFVSDTTYVFPDNLVASGQVTIRVPHGIGPSRFEVSALTMQTPGANWLNNSRVDSPVEAPSWDYISFGLTSFGTNAYQFQKDVPIPVFSFKNAADACADSVEIIVNGQDPFYPPNSAGSNIGNTLVLLGGGLNNAFSGTVGSGVVPCSPGTQCEDETVENIFLCPGETYQGFTFYQDTTVDIHYTSFAGCDSALITNIHMWENNFPPVDTLVCDGELFNGYPVFQNETVEITYTSNGGCDSTITYYVEVVQPSVITNQISILSGQAVLGIPVYNDSTLIQFLTSVSGCDSTIITQVSVFNVPVTVLNVDLCQGDTYLGNYYPSDTTLVDTLLGASGFDSIVLTNIFLHPAYFSINHVYLCQGESYNGSVYMADVSFSEELLTQHGCDSTIVTKIHVLVPQVITQDTSICQGERFNGILLQQDTVFKAIFVSVNGCDSLIRETAVSVRPRPDAAVQGVTELCTGETAVLTATGGTTYLWNTGESSSSVSLIASADLFVEVTHANGCRDTAFASVSFSNLDVQFKSVSPLCNEDITGEIRFEQIEGGAEPYLFSIDGGNLFLDERDYKDLLPGVYELEVMDARGCEWTETVEITEPAESFLELGNDLSVSLGESVRLEPYTNFSGWVSITWIPGNGLECADCLETEATPLESTTYQLLLADSNGCVVEDFIRITVDTRRNVFVPNAFSPNGDGINDFLTLFGGQDVAQVKRFSIFDRWGGQVFLAENFSPNVLSNGWNGSWKGSEAIEGTYVWMAEVEFVDGKIELFEGGVNLIR